MCKFFSFVTEPEYHGGQRFYFNAKQRETLEDIKFDSHSSICKYYNLNEDNCNKYEYNFEENKCLTDQINSCINDEVAAHEWAEKLRISRIINVNDCKLKIGSIYEFKPLRVVKKLTNWNWEGKMDYLVKSKIELVVDEHVLFREKINEPNLWKIPDSQAVNGKYWVITMDMVKLKQQYNKKSI